MIFCKGYFEEVPDSDYKELCGHTCEIKGSGDKIVLELYLIMCHMKIEHVTLALQMYERYQEMEHEHESNS